MNLKSPVCRAWHDSIHFSPVWWLSHSPYNVYQQPYWCYTATVAEQFLLLLLLKNYNSSWLPLKCYSISDELCPPPAAFIPITLNKSYSTKSLQLSCGLPLLLALSIAAVAICFGIRCFCVPSTDHTTLPQGFHKIYIYALCNMFFISFFVLTLPCSPSLTGPSRKTQLSTFQSAPVERQIVS